MFTLESNVPKYSKKSLIRPKSKPWIDPNCAHYLCLTQFPNPRQHFILFLFALIGSGFKGLLIDLFNILFEFSNLTPKVSLSNRSNVNEKSI
ncbi:hypothetical protein BpHYR1_042870 [Brachionus plicatilis]|uniref:Uncharacterized protein n=1 Tax=Brachionus plicatilis TaxID=10195 RepID=A0A3M7SFG6_BRAPC|nr:hypothetical protein BpHYR1_042870 [Brachionus plicatilis]